MLRKVEVHRRLHRALSNDVAVAQSELGLSIEHLATACNCDESTVYKALDGTRPVNGAIIEAVLDMTRGIETLRYVAAKANYGVYPIVDADGDRCALAECLDAFNRMVQDYLRATAHCGPGHERITPKEAAPFLNHAEAAIGCIRAFCEMVRAEAQTPAPKHREKF